MDNLTKINGQRKTRTEPRFRISGSEDLDFGSEPILTIEAIWNGGHITERQKKIKT